jgi:hypothetical protein
MQLVFFVTPHLDLTRKGKGNNVEKTETNIKRRKKETDLCWEKEKKTRKRKTERESSKVWSRKERYIQHASAFKAVHFIHRGMTAVSRPFKAKSNMRERETEKVNPKKKS